MSGPVRRIPPFAPKLKTQRRASPQTLGHPRFARGTEKKPESPGNPFGKEQNLGDNSRKVENGKASCFGGFREAFIGTHKVSLGGTLLAPGKGCGQLQAISGPQIVSVPHLHGHVTQLFAWKNLSPAAAQQIETGQSAMFFNVLQLSQAAQACDSAVDFDIAAPPNHRGERKEPSLRSGLRLQPPVRLPSITPSQPAHPSTPG